MTESKTLTPQEKDTIRSYRRNLWLLILISSSIDAVIFAGDVFIFGISLGTAFGGSLIVDETIEFFISSLLAKNKLRLKNRYKIVGLIPIPGVTSLSVQATLELITSYRKPKKILTRLQKEN